MQISPRFNDLGKDGTPARLGIMGGTFDPIHWGHLVTAEHAREALSLDAVLFMPTGNPVRKHARSVTNAELRYEMVVAATEDNPYFDVSRLELERKGDTYTIDTLRTLHEHYGPNVRLFFITGADAVLDIITWKDADQIARLATLIGATRPGYDLYAAQRVHEAAAVDFNVHYLEIPALAISSTYLRQRVKAGESIRYLTDTRVVDLIRQKGLYL